MTALGPGRPYRADGTCAACGAEVLWATTQNGAKQPLNPDVDPRGSVLVHKDGLGVVRARTLSAVVDGVRHPLEKIFMPHAATCRRPARSETPTNVTPFRRRRS